MIERESAIKIYSEILGMKGTHGQLIRISEQGFYEVRIKAGGESFTGLLPIQSTVILTALAEEEFKMIEVER